MADDTRDVLALIRRGINDPGSVLPRATFDNNDGTGAYDEGVGAWGARAVHRLLADAGLLLPAGGETRADWGVRYPNLHPEPVYVTDEQMARHVVATVEGSVAFRRTVHTGPWVPVDQSGEHRG